MAEELQGNDALKEEPMDVAVDIETKIHNAMRSRISHFKEQAEWAFSFFHFLLISHHSNSSADLSSLSFSLCFSRDVSVILCDFGCSCFQLLLMMLLCFILHLRKWLLDHH